jgi:alpha-1,3-fucosyltransferase
MESPEFNDWNFDRAYDDFFNWTISYRWDSDIPRPYGRFRALNESQFYPTLPVTWKAYSEDGFLRQLVQKDAPFLARADRPKKIAWIVSNCHTKSKREAYVRELSQYIDVDIMGKCGTIPCSTSWVNTIRQDNCSMAVANDYKFYLAFENSFCGK